MTAQVTKFYKKGRLEMSNKENEKKVIEMTEEEFRIRMQRGTFLNAFFGALCAMVLCILVLWSALYHIWTYKGGKEKYEGIVARVEKIEASTVEIGKTAKTFNDFKESMTNATLSGDVFGFAELICNQIPQKKDKDGGREKTWLESIIEKGKNLFGIPSEQPHSKEDYEQSRSKLLKEKAALMDAGKYYDVQYLQVGDKKKEVLNLTEDGARIEMEIIKLRVQNRDQAYDTRGWQPTPD